MRNSRVRDGRRGPWIEVGAGAAAALLVVAILVTPAPAAGGGRYCERLDDVCWSCADIEFPAEMPCATPDACGAERLCVIQASGDTCFAPFTACCETEPCETAPGCPAAASACGDYEGDGRNDACTFLSDCPDAGVPMPVDAGHIPLDGGTLPRDGGSPARDAGGTRIDSGAAADARPRLDYPVSELDFRGAGGCGCAVAGRRHPLGGPWALLLTLSVGLFSAGRRR